jgi:hypothetical protein
VKSARVTLSFFFAAAAAATFSVQNLRAAARTDDAKTAAVSPMLAANAAAKGDSLLEALLTELERSKDQLKMDQVQAPYYIEYHVNDVEDFSAEAAFGALRESQKVHVRVLRVVVRVGDYKQDSYYGQGVGEANILPLDNDTFALRHQIWLITDEAYKAAGEALAEKQAAMKQFSADTNPVDDFAKAPVITALEPTVALKVDDASWKKNLQDVTALYKQYPEVQDVSASAHFSADNEYFVNSEGTVTRGGKTTYSVQFAAYAQAEDGMRQLGPSPTPRNSPPATRCFPTPKRLSTPSSRSAKRPSWKRNIAARCSSLRTPPTMSCCLSWAPTSPAASRNSASPIAP